MHSTASLKIKAESIRDDPIWGVLGLQGTRDRKDHWHLNW